MNLNEIIVLAAAVIAFATNTALYIHLSSTVNTRFDSFERKMENRFERLDTRFDALMSKVVEIDNRMTRVETKLGLSV